MFQNTNKYVLSKTTRKLYRVLIFLIVAGAMLAPVLETVKWLTVCQIRYKTVHLFTVNLFEGKEKKRKRKDRTTWKKKETKPRKEKKKRRGERR